MSEKVIVRFKFMGSTEQVALSDGGARLPSFGIRKEPRCVDNFLQDTRSWQVGREDLGNFKGVYIFC